MKQCENCGAEVTFWMMQKQPTPFRFKCSTCKARYRISTPGMNLVILGVVLIMMVMALILGFGGERYGLVFVIPCVAVIFCMGFGIEMWVQKYIGKNGQFILMDGTTDEPDSEEVEEAAEDEASSLKEAE